MALRHGGIGHDLAKLGIHELRGHAEVNRRVDLGEVELKELFGEVLDDLLLAAVGIRSRLFAVRHALTNRSNEIQDGDVRQLGIDHGSLDFRRLSELRQRGGSVFVSHNVHSAGLAGIG